MYSNWSWGCLLSNETNLTPKFCVDQKLWPKQWVKVIFQHRFQNDLSTFELWSPIYKVDRSSRTPTGTLVPKNLWSPTCRVDGSSKTSTGALVPKKNYEVLILGWMDHQGHRRLPWSQNNLWIPTYRVDGSSRTPTSVLVSKNY